MDAAIWIGIITTVFSVVIAICGGVLAMALPLAILGGVGYFIYRTMDKSNQALAAAKTWPSTTGVVIRSMVDASGGRTTSFFANVMYEYEVNGMTYQGNVLRAGDQFIRKTSRTMGTAQAKVDEYPAGRQVTVYYDPANPANAALER